ncbi:hypothetical protein FRUB_10105 [Fimbriiglobus ruber]|uniref:Uncharacterized protein n=2 Tax=Fimbriiglobus ruber TaxID=1908690 RepID=A0A225D3F6_9BACT|nr:hypothetical protein FRUB_10105 [Fimbriiglobus ruber]
MAGVPWFFDNECQAYRVRPGFKFPAIHSSGTDSSNTPDPIVLIANAKKILADGERFLSSLRQLISALEGLSEPPTC